MINTIITGLFEFITSIVNILLYPINLLIDQYFPDITNALVLVRQLFGYLFQFSGWILDACLISPETISLLISYLTVRYTVPYLVYGIKLAIRWYESLKL